MSLQNLPQLAAQLDKHLLYPIILFLEKTPEGAAAVADAKKELLEKMSFFDVAMDMHADNPAKVEELGARKDALVKKLNTLTTFCDPILKFFFKSEEGVLRLDKLPRDLAKMKEEGQLSVAELATQCPGVNGKVVAKLFELAWHSYEAGGYDQASDILQLYLAIEGKDATDANEAHALWGKLVCDQVMGWWDAARQDIDSLRTRFEKEATTLQRSWLLHWSLFTYFKRSGASQLLLEHIIDFSTFAFANTIEVASPHLIRYLAAAAILNKKKRSFMRRVLLIIERNTYNYRDPITDFLDAMGNQSNFAKGTELLRQCELEFENDYFLQESKDELLNNARMLLYEDYMRVHRTVSIPSVASRLGMTQEQTELWLVNLIRETKMDATIDSVKGLIFVTPAGYQRTVFRDVLDRLESFDRISSA